MKLIKKTLAFILIIIILVLAVVIAGGWGKYKQAVSLMPLETAATNIKTQESFTPIDEISKKVFSKTQKNGCLILKTVV